MDPGKKNLLKHGWKPLQFTTESVPVHGAIYFQLIDGMVFNTVFNSASAISRRPVHLPMPSWSFFFKPVLSTISFPRHWLLSNITIVKTTDSGKRGMNPVAMTIYHQSSGRLFVEPGIEPETSCSRVRNATD